MTNFMIALIQRVSEASVHVNGKVVGEIESGILALVGVEKGDSEIQAERLLQRVLAYRIFPDGEGRMNLNIEQSGGRLLLVSQFTLAANTRTNHVNNTTTTNRSARDRTCLRAKQFDDTSTTRRTHEQIDHRTSGF